MVDVVPAIGGAGLGLGNDYMRSMVRQQLQQNAAARRGPPVQETTTLVANQVNGGMSNELATTGGGAIIGNDLQDLFNPWSLAVYGADMVIGAFAGGNGWWNAAMQVGRGVHEVYREVPFRPRYFPPVGTTSRRETGRREPHQFIYETKYPYRSSYKKQKQYRKRRF